MHKIFIKKHYMIIVAALIFGNIESAILETLGIKAAMAATAKIGGAITAKWAAVKTTVIVGKLTVETAAMTTAATAAVVGTIVICDKIWNLATTTLVPTHQQKIKAFKVQQWQFNEKALAENKQLREQVEALKAKLQQSEEVAQRMLAEAQLKFAQYCEINNCDPNDSNLPSEGKKLQIAVGLIYCCLRIIYP